MTAVATLVFLALFVAGAVGVIRERRVCADERLRRTLEFAKWRPERGMADVFGSAERGRG